MIVVAFSPIGRGILSGRFQTHVEIPETLRKVCQKYSVENFPQILDLVPGLHSGDCSLRLRSHSFTSGPDLAIGAENADHPHTQGRNLSIAWMRMRLLHHFGLATEIWRLSEVW